MRLPIEESCLPRETTRTKKGVKKNKRKQIKQTLSATPTGSYNKRPAARPSNQRKKVGCIQKFDKDDGSLLKLKRNQIGRHRYMHEIDSLSGKYY